MQRCQYFPKLGNRFFLNLGKNLKYLIIKEIEALAIIQSSGGKPLYFRDSHTQVLTKSFYYSFSITLLYIHFADVAPYTPIEFNLAGVYLHDGLDLLAPKS
jgi:hypothetical protein